jgi:hypothetical protein
MSDDDTMFDQTDGQFDDGTLRGSDNNQFELDATTTDGTELVGRLDHVTVNNAGVDIGGRPMQLAGLYR